MHPFRSHMRAAYPQDSFEQCPCQNTAKPNKQIDPPLQIQQTPPLPAMRPTGSPITPPPPPTLAAPPSILWRCHHRIQGFLVGTSSFFFLPSTLATRLSYLQHPGSRQN